jgi:2-methylcitrate dehydratase PrpD
MSAAVEDQVHAGSGETVQEAAFLTLTDALACAFLALQQPACARLLGPLVPGATMAFGARVPGTSYQLDPVHAAFNIGTSISWLGANDPRLATPYGQLADNFGAILAVGDYQARKSIAEGRTPPTVHDLFRALLVAQECAAREATQSGSPGVATSSLREENATEVDEATRCALVRIASAAASMSLLGGTHAQVMAAIELARAEARYATPPGTHCRWRLGDATSRGVRLALLAIADAASAGPQGAETVGADHARLYAGSAEIVAGPWQAVVGEPAIGHCIRERFTAAVVGHFPTVQAGKILTLFGDRARLDALPVNELVSMTVRN